jgi:hypothetical protein
MPQTVLSRVPGLAAAAVLLAAAAMPVQAADVAVSIAVSQPGVYGRIDIGRFPQPEVILPQPVVIVKPRVVPVQPVQPVYLWVPPGHQKNWSKHCGRYNACGAPVYFVQDRWYQDHVKGDGHGKDKDKDKDKDKQKDKGKGHDD